MSHPSLSPLTSTDTPAFLLHFGPLSLTSRPNDYTRGMKGENYNPALTSVTLREVQLLRRFSEDNVFTHCARGGVKEHIQKLSSREWRLHFAATIFTPSILEGATVREHKSSCWCGDHSASETPSSVKSHSRRKYGEFPYKIKEEGHFRVADWSFFQRWWTGFLHISLTGVSFDQWVRITSTFANLYCVDHI